MRTSLKFTALGLVVVGLVSSSALAHKSSASQTVKNNDSQGRSAQELTFSGGVRESDKEDYWMDGWDVALVDLPNNGQSFIYVRGVMDYHMDGFEPTDNAEFRHGQQETFLLLEAD